MSVTPAGIVIPVSALQSWKARFPMLATGSPLIESGITTAPPGPVYPVIVMVLLLVV
jgi:hypothetical protein